MKRFILALLLIFTFGSSTPAQADWRWSPPTLKKQKVTFNCNTAQCIKASYKTAMKKHRKRVARYNKRRLQEWKHWAFQPIPACTWYGESGTGPQYASYRYTMPNSSGSGAYGKYQMMSGTYHNRAKYHDWSPLDQEIAGHREYYANGTGPWANCTG